MIALQTGITFPHTTAQNAANAFKTLEASPQTVADAQQPVDEGNVSETDDPEVYGYTTGGLYHFGAWEIYLRLDGWNGTHGGWCPCNSVPKGFKENQHDEFGEFLETYYHEVQHYKKGDGSPDTHSTTDEEHAAIARRSANFFAGLYAYWLVDGGTPVCPCGCGMPWTNVLRDLHSGFDKAYTSYARYKHFKPADSFPPAEPTPIK